MSDISTPCATQNPLDTVKRLAEFLEKPATPECAEVVEACSFKKQKESEEADEKLQAMFYRKGR